MHSFHQSRGRILFEALCALGISASLAGAWLQTQASAVLPAAALALVLGLVRMSDMSRRSPDNAAERREEHPIDVPTPWDESAVAEPVEEVGETAVTKPRAKRAKAPRKTAKARKEPVAKPAAVEEPESVAEEVTPLPLEPLFDPQPFARQQHAVFGRKARFG
ncbi:MAG TPA: hypothetical protein VH392_01535 [Sphingomicrobium sp.]